MSCDHVDSACRLYFDIEFKKELNPQVNGISLLEVFIKVGRSVHVDFKL